MRVRKTLTVFVTAAASLLGGQSSAMAATGNDGGLLGVGGRSCVYGSNLQQFDQFINITTISGQVNWRPKVDGHCGGPREAAPAGHMAVATDYWVWDQDLGWLVCADSDGFVFNGEPRSNFIVNFEVPGTLCGDGWYGSYTYQYKWDVNAGWVGDALWTGFEFYELASTTPGDTGFPSGLPSPLLGKDDLLDLASLPFEIVGGTGILTVSEDLYEPFQLIPTPTDGVAYLYPLRPSAGVVHLKDTVG